MKVYLIWAWFDSDEPMVIAVTDSHKKAENIITKAESDEDNYSGYEFSIDERELNSFENTNY